MHNEPVYVVYWSGHGLRKLLGLPGQEPDVPLQVAVVRQMFQFQEFQGPNDKGCVIWKRFNKSHLIIIMLVDQLGLIILPDAHHRNVACLKCLKLCA